MLLNHRTIFAACVLLLSLQSGLGVCEGAKQEGTKPEAAKQETATPIEVFARQRGYTVIKRFPTDAAALTGYVLKNQHGKYGILYEVGDLIIAGQVVDKDGKNLSDQYESENIPQPDYVAAVKTLESDKYLVIDGKKGAPVIYAIADPNCTFCHRLYAQTRDWVKQGKVQLRWVMVGFLKPSSPGRAAAIMAAKDRAKAYVENYSAFDEKTEEGGLAELKPIPADLQKVLQAHEKLMSDLRFQGTPGLIYKTKDGKWQGVAGLLPLPQLAQRMGLSQ